MGSCDLYLSLEGQKPVDFHHLKSLKI